VDIADAIIKLAPDRVNGWIHRSFALHELKRTQEAFDQLVPVADKFSKVWTIPYNLACYCAQLGRLEECKAWFQKAMAIDEHTVKRAPIDDPDLNTLGLHGRNDVAAYGVDCTVVVMSRLVLTRPAVQTQGWKQPDQ
jgi:tetratricopeptide (TPR) repeat protein